MKQKFSLILSFLLIATGLLLQLSLAEKEPGVSEIKVGVPLSELEKLRKIKQPKNKKAIFFLQASDNPDDERKSISSLRLFILRLFIQKNIFSFSGLAVKRHPSLFCQSRSCF